MRLTCAFREGSGRFSGRFSERFSEHFSGLFSGQFSERFSGRYSGMAVAKEDIISSSNSFDFHCLSRFKHAQISAR